VVAILGVLKNPPAQGFLNRFPDCSHLFSLQVDTLVGFILFINMFMIQKVQQRSLEMTKWESIKKLSHDTELSMKNKDVYG